MVKCIIFQETSRGLDEFENEINNYFGCYDNVNIISVTPHTERVDGSDYLNLVVFYELSDADEEDL
jgi:hypothetical protein